MSPLRAALCLSFLACAGPSAELATPAAPTRLEPRKAAPFDARSFAADQPTPADCESAARRLHETSPDAGWSALKGCVERSRWPRGQFTQLQALTSGFWDNDLQSRPDAARLLARVIAARGGDIEGDVPSLQRARAPLFTLSAAMKQPDVYKGRYVLLRGALDDVKVEGGKTTALVLETSLRATAHEVDVGTRSRTEHTTSGQLDSKSTRLGNASLSTQSHARTESGTVARKFENERSETGRQALGRLPEADPFLEPGKDFVFLARFDGLRAQPDSDRPIAVLTILAYDKPDALLIE